MNLICCSLRYHEVCDLFKLGYHAEFVTLFGMLKPFWNCTVYMNLIAL